MYGMAIAPKRDGLSTYAQAMPTLLEQDTIYASIKDKGKTICTVGHGHQRIRERVASGWMTTVKPWPRSTMYSV